MEAVHKIHTHLDLNLNELRNVRLDHHESNPEPASGRIIYNPISHEIRYSDGEKWYSISLGCWSFDEDGNIVAEGDIIIRGGSLSGTLRATDIFRLNSTSDARNCAVFRASSGETNIGTLDIGTNYGFSNEGNNITQNIKYALSIANGCVGIGREYLYNELYNNEKNDIVLDVYKKARIGSGLIVSSGGADITGNVRIKGHLIVEGDASSGGTGQDTPSGGVTEEDVEQYLTNYVNDITTTGDGNVISAVSKSGKKITFTKGVTALTSHQYIYALTIKNSEGTILTTYTPNSAEKSLTLTKAMVGLSNVENKSSATIREEITASNVTTALGYTPYNSANFIKANIKSTLGISDWALAASKPSYTKTEVGLGNVENTALSSWAGTNNITTLGTITSGTWKGSKIANAYLANNAISIAGTSVSLGGSIETSTITAAQIGSGNSFYHSGNANKTSVAWNASSLTMNGALTGATTGTFSSKLTANTLVLSNTEGKAHLTFSRGGINYIHANQSGGGVAFVVNGSGITLANAQLIISSDNYVYCGTEGLAQLGLDGKRWKSVYSIDGSFSGDLTAGTFSTSSAVACGGRLRITADNSANNFGFLKSTWTTASNYGLMHIGTNEGGTSTITNAAYDKVAMSISRSVVGIGRQYSYDELKGYNDSNTRLYVDGNLVVTGDAASGSDIRFKDVIENKTIRIDDIANAPLFSFKWNDRDDDSIHLGTSAQYWESIAPELVSGKDFKTLNYASLGVAMGIALAKKNINHEERIKMLEDEIKVLNQELRRIKDGICN